MGTVGQAKARIVVPIRALPDAAKVGERTLLLELAALMREAPDVRCVVCHFGFPIRRTAEALEVWRAGIAEVAACPNAFVKLSKIKNRR